jgi:hypothetical protein
MTISAVATGPPVAAGNMVAAALWARISPQFLDEAGA